MLHSFGLDAADNWIFADPMPERLRYRVDPNWFGELPRAYLYTDDHQRTAHSGILSEADLQQWLQNQPPPSATPSTLTDPQQIPN